MAHVLMILGLVALVAFIVSRRKRDCWRREAYTGDADMMEWGRGPDRWERKIARAQEKVERVVQRAERYRGGWFTTAATPSSSGNAAFDEYRNETLKRLEEEQKEFKDFLERLRVAKDRAEFDAFMNDRRRRDEPPQAPPPPPAPQG